MLLYSSELSSHWKSNIRIFTRGNEIPTLGLLQDGTVISPDCSQRTEPHTDNISQKESRPSVGGLRVQRKKANRDGRYSQRHLKIQQFLGGNHLMLSFGDGWVSLLPHSHLSGATSTSRNWLWEERSKIKLHISSGIKLLCLLRLVLAKGQIHVLATCNQFRM